MNSFLISLIPTGIHYMSGRRQRSGAGGFANSNYHYDSSIPTQADLRSTVSRLRTAFFDT